MSDLSASLFSCKTDGNISPVCAENFSRNSISTIVWLIIGTIVALFFASLAYSFYRQLLDPLAFRAQAPSDQVRLEALRRPYAQGQYGYASEPLHGGAYGGGLNPYPAFAPPLGPPPGAPPYESAKLPGYGADDASRAILDGDKKDGDPFNDGGLEERGGERDPFSDGENAGKRI